MQRRHSFHLCGGGRDWHMKWAQKDRLDLEMGNLWRAVAVGRALPRKGLLAEPWGRGERLSFWGESEGRKSYRTGEESEQRPGQWISSFRSDFSWGRWSVIYTDHSFRLPCLSSSYLPSGPVSATGHIPLRSPVWFQGLQSHNYIHGWYLLRTSELNSFGWEKLLESNTEQEWYCSSSYSVTFSPYPLTWNLVNSWGTLWRSNERCSFFWVIKLRQPKTCYFNWFKWTVMPHCSTPAITMWDEVSYLSKWTLSPLKY